MGRFRIKDLMVDVVVGDQLKIDVDRITPYLCYRYGPPSCNYLTSIIDWESICHRFHTTELFEIPLTPLTEEVYEHFWEIDPVEMAALREQYKVAIEQIDLAEQIVAVASAIVAVTLRRDERTSRGS